MTSRTPERAAAEKAALRPAQAASPPPVRGAANPPSPLGTAGGEGGPRSWTLELPAGLKVLNLNDTLHWGEKYRRSQSLQKAAWAMALQAKIPRLERIAVWVEYQPPDLRKHDDDNLGPTAKACIDGIKKAGIVPDDSSDHVRYDGCRIGSLYPKGRVVIHITEAGAQ